MCVAVFHNSDRSRFKHVLRGAIGAQRDVQMDEWMDKAIYRGRSRLKCCKAVKYAGMFFLADIGFYLTMNNMSISVHI